MNYFQKKVCYKALGLLALMMTSPFAANLLYAPPPPPDPGAAIPIGGGAGILLAGAAAYGAKQLWDRYRR
jgi:hypothetical protein